MGDCRSIASRSVGDCDAFVLAIVEVDVVGAYGGGGNESTTRMVEQGGIASCASTGDECVGGLHCVGSNLFGSEIFYVAIRLKNTLDKRNLAFDDDIDAHDRDGLQREGPKVERCVDEDEYDDGDVGASVAVDDEEVSDLHGCAAVEQRDVDDDIGVVDDE